MATRTLRSNRKLVEILEQSSDNGHEEEAIVFNETTEIIYIPPATVDALSDEEQIDDENLMNDIDPTLEIAGEFEINYASTVKDFSGPSTSTAHSESDRRPYTVEAKFGKPTWKKLKRYSFKFPEIDEDVVTPLEQTIVQDHGKWFNNFAIP